MRVLLIEDDELLGKGVKKALQRDDYQVEWLTDGKSSLAALETDHFDLIILDLMLPDMSGLTVLSQLRKDQISTSVLILTSLDSLDDKVKGLDTGADDYLVKPFQVNELKARIRALTRREYGQKNPVIAMGSLTINSVSMEVSWQNKAVELSRREFTLLMEFVNHRGQVLTRKHLDNTIYGWDCDIESNAIEVHIHHLRKKITPKLFRTIRGIGYKMEKNNE